MRDRTRIEMDQFARSEMQKRFHAGGPELDGDRRANHKAVLLGCIALALFHDRLIGAPS